MSAARMPAKPSARVRRQKARTAARRRHAAAAERERLEAAIEAAIYRLDQLDGDCDFEDSDDAEDVREDDEDTWDHEYDPAELAQLDLADDEPSENYPVSGHYLGRPDLVPQPAATERDWQAVGAMALPSAPRAVRALPEPPAGYGVIRVIR